MADSPSTSVERSGSKRKSEDGTGPHSRAKRNRYISIACNECKRRKIKCNGETPCQRCGNLRLECLYAPNCCSNTFKDSEEFKQMSTHLLSLQEQVDGLYNNVHALRNTFESHPSTDDTTSHLQRHRRSVSKPQVSLPSASPVSGRKSSVQKHPSFRGPTSSAFEFGIAKSSLQMMGITGPEENLDEDNVAQNGTSTESAPLATHPSRDPIWGITKREALRLCIFYEEEIGMFHPMLNIQRMTRHATQLFTFIDAANRTGFIPRELPGADAIDDENTLLLKLVLSVAIVMESNRPTALGSKLFDNVRPYLEQKLIGPPAIDSIRIFTIAALYFFYRDDVGVAWRVLGLASRLCLELGLHRRNTYDKIFSNEEERSDAIIIFWTVYVLDRRWSFGTGLPFGIQEADIDPLTPKPLGSDPHLTAMIAYGQIASKIWKSVANLDIGRNDFNKEEINYLDYQAVQWYAAIPDELRYRHSTDQEQQPTHRITQRLRVVLYLRANQMRISIYCPILYSATSIMENLGLAQTVTALARDTIRVIAHVDQTSDMYHRQQVSANYFLVSALAVLFLAVTHAPTQFSDTCREEFYMALELVRGLSARSYVSERLWKMIRGLKEIGPKLGLSIPSNGAFEPNDAHSSAAVAMAGLAGHAVDEMAFLQQGMPQGGKMDAVPPDEERPGMSLDGMANDLTALFEAAGGYGGIIGNGVNGGFPVTAAAPQGELGGVAGDAPGAPGGFGNEYDEVTRILRDLS